MIADAGGVQLIGVAEAALLTGRSPATIYSWVSRRHLTAVGHVKGRAVFTVEAVWDAERDTRRRGPGRPPRVRESA